MTNESGNQIIGDKGIEIKKKQSVYKLIEFSR